MTQSAAWLSNIFRAFLTIGQPPERQMANKLRTCVCANWKRKRDSPGFSKSRRRRRPVQQPQIIAPGKESSTPSIHGEWEMRNNLIIRICLSSTETINRVVGGGGHLKSVFFHLARLGDGGDPNERAPKPNVLQLNCYCGHNDSELALKVGQTRGVCRRANCKLPADEKRLPELARK